MKKTSCVNFFVVFIVIKCYNQTQVIFSFIVFYLIKPSEKKLGLQL